MGLGVFDYLADLFRFDNSRRGGQILGGDLPAPLALSPMFPFGFVVAIGYAGAAATVWACIIPAPAGEEVPGAGPGRGGVQAPAASPWWWPSSSSGCLPPSST